MRLTDIKEISSTMTNEEIFLNNRMRRRNHFTVPEGYFDEFTQKVMSRLPEEKPRKAWIRSLRPVLYVAACLCVAIFCGTIYFGKAADNQPQLMASVTGEPTISDEYLDEAADYAMVDNHDIYACLMNE